jgi:hypothetical protein
MNKDSLYSFLADFKNLAMEEQGDFTLDLFDVLDRVSEGVWQQHDGGFYAYHQCAFCHVSPDHEHDEWCSVIKARKLKEKIENV